MADPLHAEIWLDCQIKRSLCFHTLFSLYWSNIYKEIIIYPKTLIGYGFVPMVISLILSTRRKLLCRTWIRNDREVPAFSCQGSRWEADSKLSYRTTQILAVLALLQKNSGKMCQNIVHSFSLHVADFIISVSSLNFFSRSLYLFIVGGSCHFITGILGAWEMHQWLRVCTSLAEEQSWKPSIHIRWFTTACSAALEDLDSLASVSTCPQCTNVPNTV